MKQEIKTGLVIGSIIANTFLPSTGNTQETNIPLNFSGEISQITRTDKKPMQKGQMWIKGLPFDIDIYGLLEHSGDEDLYKIRMASLPIKKDFFSIGATIQYEDRTNVGTNNDYGLALRLQGKPTENMFGKVDLRYFPERNTFDGYGFLSKDPIFLDCVASYDHDSGFSMFMPGVDYQFDKWSLGLETKLKGNINELKSQYVGIRAKFKF